MRHWKQSLGSTLSVVLIGVASAGSAALSADATDQPAPASAPGSFRLTTAALVVDVSTEFPQVLSYAHARGGTLGGRAERLDSMVLNGTGYAVETDATRAGPDKAVYDLRFPDLPGVSMDASITVAGNVTTFAIDAIEDTEAFRVGTIDIPNHDLVSVSSRQPGATVATAIVSPNRTTGGDTITPVTADTPADAQRRGSAYAFVTGDRLAAGIETNSTYDLSSGPAANEEGRIWRQARKEGAETSMSLWSGQWTYRAAGAPFAEEGPWAKVVVTPDANGDGAVDWQDGAVAFRAIAQQPKGWQRTADRVVPHIPFNFASQATHPFLRTLDDVKRISLATDGLGQLAMLKGYGSEGHDSAHPDYGGNYNTRAGGLTDLNTLLAEGQKWGAEFGVHVNATEAYPEANAFSEVLVNKGAPGWNWIDQSYYIDQRRDLASGDIQGRFAQLRRETHPNLKFLYIDVYYQYGWLQERLARELYGQGWQLGTEWSYHFEEQSLWSHWANDESYGGSTNKGLNSQIIRFVRNHQKDTWNPHPILGNPEVREFEGWTGETDWNAFYDNIWQRNLPAKFLQKQQILDWSEREIRFTGDVRATNAGTDLAERDVFVGDAQVLDGDSYLLPWTTARGPEKLYHYNTAGGTTTWELTTRWSQARQLALYELTDQGRDFVANVPVRDGAVTVEAKAGTAYVLERRRGSDDRPVPDPKWGQASHVVDPGFNAGDLRSWDTTGNTAVETNDKGQAEGLLRGGGPASISQSLTGLQPGSWAANVQIEVEPGKTRQAAVEVSSGGATTKTRVSRSTARNYVAEDEKHSSYFQRVEVRFEVGKEGVPPRLTIAADAGDARVKIDNVRIVKVTGAGVQPPTVVAAADFESVTQGWNPFVKGDAGGVTGARTHLAEKNAPYTQAGWNGKLVDDVIGGEWSLKSHGENAGLVYRTVPQTARFEPGHRYRVSFDHEVSESGRYEWVTGYDTVGGGVPRSVEVDAAPLDEQRSAARFSEEFVAGDCGDYWLGVRKVSAGGPEADLIVDNFVVEDLGVSDHAVGCATITLTPKTAKLVRGRANQVDIAFVNRESEVAKNVSTTVQVPDGWTAAPQDSAVIDQVAPGATATVAWMITPPESAADGSHRISATATYTAGARSASVDTDTAVGLLPAGYLPQDQITIAEVTSEETEAENTPAIHALDGDPATFWGSRWSGTPAGYPHHITLDLGATYGIGEFRYLPRQDQANDRIKDYEVHLSADGVTFTRAAAGSWPNSAAEQVVALNGSRARFIKLVGLNAVNGQPFAGAAELNVVVAPQAPHER